MQTPKKHARWNHLGILLLTGWLASCGGSSAPATASSAALSSAAVSTSASAKPAGSPNNAAPSLSAGAAQASAAARPVSSVPSTGSAAASGSAALTGASAAGASGRVKVKLGTPARPDQAVLYLAMARGYWDKQGLDVEVAQIDSGAQMVPALSTNQIQVGGGAPSAALYNALNRGINIRLVVDFAHIGGPDDRTLAILARSDANAKTLADMKGKHFGIGGVKGGIGDIMFVNALRKEGLKESDFQSSYLPFPDILAGLGGKSLEAGEMTEPFVTQAVSQKIATVMYPGGVLIPGAELSVLQFSPQFASEQSQAATKFIVGFLQAVRDYNDAFIKHQGEDEVISQLVERLPVKDPQVWKTSAPLNVDPNGKINVDDLKSQAQFYQEQGTLQGGVPDFSKYLDTRFAEEAVKQLGAR